MRSNLLIERYSRAGILATFILAVLLLPGCKKQNAYVPPPPVKVGVAHPVQQMVTPYLEVTGTAQAYNDVDLVARVEGFLQEIDYTDGATVKRGTTLFIIEPAPFQARLQQAQAQLGSAQADLVQKQADFVRQSSLGRSDFSSKETVEQARALRDEDQASVDNLQAGVTLAATNLGYTHVTAPFDGMVTEHLVSVGALVGVTSPTKLASIVQLEPIYVTFNVSEQDVLRIKAAMRRPGQALPKLDSVPVEVGLMTETGYPHAGHLDYVAPQIDTSTGTLTVRGVLANTDRAVLPGMFLRVRVPVSLQAAQSLLVPDVAIGSDQGGHYVLVVDKNNVVQQRAVTTGSLVGSLRVIESGVATDDRVVISGTQKAIPGQKVDPQDTPVQ
ncbi:MAG TPA: efflux RND transporter periplasmic adaptor subunit [Acetobacteraceae bacterium]